MNIFDFGDKAACGCQIPHWSLAYLEPQDIADPVSRTREGQVLWPDSLQATRTRLPFDPTLVDPVSPCRRGRQIMLASREKLFDQTGQRGGEPQ